MKDRWIVQADIKGYTGHQYAYYSFFISAFIDYVFCKLNKDDIFEFVKLRKIK